MRQTWDEQRPNQAAILAYIAREAVGGRAAVHEAEPIARWRAFALAALLAFGALLVWLAVR